MDLKKLKNCVLSKAFASVDGTRLVSEADIRALKYVVTCLVDGNFEAAAIEAGATGLSLEIWESAILALKELE